MDNWAHIDIAGVMDAHGETPYLQKGMSGNNRTNYSIVVPLSIETKNQPQKHTGFSRIEAFLYSVYCFVLCLGA